MGRAQILHKEPQDHLSLQRLFESQINSFKHIMLRSREYQGRQFGFPKTGFEHKLI